MLSGSSFLLPDLCSHLRSQMILNLDSVLAYFECYRINQTPSISKSSYSLFICCANHLPLAIQAGQSLWTHIFWIVSRLRDPKSGAWNQTRRRSQTSSALQQTSAARTQLSAQLGAGVRAFVPGMQSKCCAVGQVRWEQGEMGKQQEAWCGAGPSADCFAALALVHSWPWALCLPMPSMILATWETPADLHLWPGMVLALLEFSALAVVTF